MKSMWYLLASGLLFCGCYRNHQPGGLSPSEALRSFKLADGFALQLVASEPLISDPVAMEVDENGDLYVVEMHGYPMDTSGTGAVKLLRDTNGDGLPDKAFVFAEKLRLPTGVMRWKKGLLVVDVPNVLYLEDSTGDGRADIRLPVLTGLALTNPQHIANTPLLGLDNWIYLAHMGTITPKVALQFNDSGAAVRMVQAPGAPVLPTDANGRNIRFNPDRRQLEMLSGESQYGQIFDNWGHHFCVENADHIFHEVIAAPYLARNPALMVADASAYISDHGDACAVYPITINPENQLLTDRGVVTSACGITWYNGGLFPDSFHHTTFVCEPTGNLIHADRVQAHGATFSATAQYQRREFLASTDGWFRPVFQYIGPDGALYVVDYYRQIIEHPEWLSDEVIQSGALYNGTRQGRIYRIAPQGAAPMRWSGDATLAKSNTAQLVAALSSNNIWWRRNAQRLLLDRHDSAAPAMLRRLLDTTTRATAVVHALWALDGFDALDPAVLSHATQHPEAGVRENAIQLIEAYLARWPQLAPTLYALQNDTDARVRFQLLCTLGGLPGAASAAVQERILLRDLSDRWVQTAALANARDGGLALLHKLLPERGVQQRAGLALFCANSAAAIALGGNEGDIQAVLQLATRKPLGAAWQTALMEGLHQGFVLAPPPGMDVAGVQRRLLPLFAAATSPQLRRQAVSLLSLFQPARPELWQQYFDQAMAVAASNRADAAYRADALRLLALRPNAGVQNLCMQMLQGDGPEQVQQAAVQTLNRQDARSACASVVRNWQKLSLPVKDAAMDVLLSSPENMLHLLDAVAAKAIVPAAISWPQKVQLMNHDDPQVRTKARQLLATDMAEREAVYKRYLPALQLQGRIAKGREVFTAVCASCHQYESGLGYTYGPDLGSVRNRDKASIMADIIDPNRSIAVQYDLWQLILNDGRKLSGVLQQEQGSSLNLVQPGGRHTLLPRSAIREMEKSNVSGMPVGLEAALTPQQMAHLLAWLTGKE